MSRLSKNVRVATLLSLGVGVAISVGAIAQAAPTTTIKKKKSTTVTTVKKASTTEAPKTATTVPGAAGTPGATPKPSTVTTVPGKVVKGTVFIPGAGRVLDLGPTEVAKLASGGRVEADVRGATGLAASGTGTVILDVTVANPSAPGKVTLTPVAPDFARAIASSSVGFGAGATTVSRVTVPVGTGGLVRVATTAGPSGLAVAVVGWIVPAPAGTSEPSAIAIETCRVLDTVSGLGGLQGEVTPARPFDLPAVGIAKVPAAVGAALAPTGVVLAIGASQASGPLEVTVVPTGSQTPSLVLSMNPGQNSSAQFVVPVGADARAAVYVSANGVQLTVDMIAWLDKDGVAHSGGPC